MACTSRTTALALLDAILEEADNLREVEGLRSVKVNPFLESELEARFVEALRRIDVDGKPVRVREDIVGGKPGFVLTTANLTYYMEAQPEFGEANGVALASRPDFVIRPARECAAQPPIVVFMDGFEYHRGTTDDDSAKRMALVQAGFLVWSLTWHDLEVALGKGDDALDVLGDAAHMADVQQELDRRWGTGLVRSRLDEPSLKLLIRYLQKPDAEAWKRAVFTDLLRLFDPDDMTSASLREAFIAASAQLAPEFWEAVVDLAGLAFAGRGKWRGTAPDRFVQVLLAMPLVSMVTPWPEELMVVVDLDDAAQSEAKEYGRAWNGVLRLYNLLQFLPRSRWTTTLGVRRDVYPEFAPTARAMGVFAPTQPEWAAGVSWEWAEAITLAAEELRPALRELAEWASPPQVGFEMTDSSGRVVAEAELAWEAGRVAVVLSAEGRVLFEQAGWRVFQADDADLATRLRDALAEVQGEAPEGQEENP